VTSFVYQDMINVIVFPPGEVQAYF